MMEEKLLSRIRGLLDKANSTEFEEERAALLAKAEEMMARHEIEMADLDASRPDMRRSVTTRDVDRPVGEFAAELRNLIDIFAGMRNIRIAVAIKGSKVVYSMVGYQDDIDFVELLYTTTMLDFSSKIAPTWDPRSAGSPAIFDSCVRAHKEAGHKWVEIARLANKYGGNPRTGKLGSTTDGAWLKAAYRRECLRLGIAPTRQTQRHEAFRKTYAAGFVTTIRNRVWRMQRASEEAIGEISSNLPAVRDSRERVNEEFYRLFPNMRPATEEEMAKRSAKWAEEDAKAEQERQEFLDSLTPAQRQSFLGKEERRRRQDDAKYERERRRNHDDRGWDAGSRAASKVDLSGGVNHLVGKKEIR